MTVYTNKRVLGNVVAAILLICSTLACGLSSQEANEAVREAKHYMITQECKGALTDPEEKGDGIVFDYTGCAIGRCKGAYGEKIPDVIECIVSTTGLTPEEAKERLNQQY